MTVRAYKRISSTLRKQPSNPAHAAAEPAQTSDAAVAPPPQWLELYERYLPAARAIPDADVRVCRTDVSVARDNAAFGVASLLGRAQDVAALPGVSVAQLRGFEDLGRALAYAATCATRAAPIASDTKAALVAARVLRAKLLAKAEVLVFDGIVPAAVVSALRRGKGPIDAAGDCVALAKLFHDYAEPLAKVLVIDPAEVRAADELGSRLLDTLRRGASKRRPDRALAAALDMRNRLWTLFEQTWDHHVWRPSIFLFGRRAELLVPPLSSRVRAKRAPKPQVQPGTSEPTGATEASESPPAALPSH
jgi:hypothetical protein